ncbi:hypothetical protein [Streptomyces chryseus]|uniref:Lipoprotein n=1 Tax=Streptomyces chryseus TaxID=68186 RepID=A0ABQ3DPN6_9ACTN|nr:hypothetical protein [Streptomyces chryseus]GHB04858.1 hypothetical protein GCM10010346_29790 [Streptomyces chryseus]
MNIFARWTVLICAGCAALLSSCTADSARPSVPPGPTVTSTVAPDPAAQLAERYRQSGGEEDVYGIQRSSGPDGTPLLTVWTHNPDEDAEIFDHLKGSIAGYLEREEGLSLRRGYLMDVFGPDGALQHRLDART